MMRKLIAATLAGLLGLAGTAAAQQYPPAAPAPVKAPVTLPPAAMAGQGVVVSPAPCATGCCMEQHCTPITETRTKIKPCYTSVCEPYCNVACVGCSLFGGGFHGCNSGCDSGCTSGCGEDHKCSKVRTRKILVVKLKRTEECVNKCVVTSTPVSPAPCAAPCTKPCPPTCGSPVSAAPCATPCTKPCPPTCGSPCDDVHGLIPMMKAH
jgi:hypothetical protein